jgi:SAM-dependent methyltransferase
VEVNRSYFVHYVLASGARRVLDYGCGNGEVVAELRRRGVDCYGTDVFYEGGRFGTPDLDQLVADGSIRRYEESDPTPFPDRTFDLIISNQVFEHVADLDAAVAELDRILAGDGVMYHHFPSREVLREGHIGIPLAHRLPPGHTRTAYTLALRTLGAGHHKTVPRRAWTKRSLEWLDTYTFYRSHSEIMHAFGKRFVIRGREADYCRFRARDRRFRPLLSHFDGLQAVALRRLAFMALEMRRR